MTSEEIDQKALSLKSVGDYFSVGKWKVKRILDNPPKEVEDFGMDWDMFSVHHGKTHYGDWFLPGEFIAVEDRELQMKTADGNQGLLL